MFVFLCPFGRTWAWACPTSKPPPCPYRDMWGSFRSANICYITLALATRRLEASSQLRHNRLRPLSLNSAGLSDRGVDSGSDQTGDVTFASRDSCAFHKALDGASHVSHSLFLAFAFGMVGVSMALPGLEPTTKSPGSEVRRANHCAAGAPHVRLL